MCVPACRWLYCCVSKQMQCRFCKGLCCCVFLLFLKKFFQCKSHSKVVHEWWKNVQNTEPTRFDSCSCEKKNTLLYCICSVHGTLRVLMNFLVLVHRIEWKSEMGQQTQTMRKEIAKFCTFFKKKKKTNKWQFLAYFICVSFYPFHS